MDMKSITQKLQDDIRAIMEAGLHPNQQKIDVHEPEKDELTADDFKKLRAKKEVKKEEVEELDEISTKLLAKAASAASDPMKHYDDNEKYHDPQKFADYAAKKKDAKSAAAVQGAANAKGHYPRPNQARGYDSLASRSPSRVTAAGKANKQDIKTLKSRLKEDEDLDEARKLEGTYSHSNGNQSKVYKLSGEHNEGDPYHVKLFKGGKHYEPADYFTNDKEDAHATAKSMVKEEIELDELSKSTLGSYAKKATTDAVIKRKIAGDFENMSDRARKPGMKQAADVNAQKYKEQSWKRRHGVEKAINRLTKEEVEESIDETIVKHDSFTVDIKDSYTFSDYLTAAKQLVGEEEAVKYANDAFKVQDLTIFMMEEMSRGDIESNINAHRKAGHTVSMPKYSTKDGKPYAEYTVTDKDEGTRRKYIHHGNVRKVENMGAKG